MAEKGGEEGGNVELLRQYLSHLQHERRLSPLTGKNYARDIDELFRLAGETPLADLQIQQIRRFIAQLHARGLGSRTLARMLSAWRGFYSYLGHAHGFVHNPCTGVKAPKAAKTLPQALSPEQAAHLMEVPPDDTLAVRDHAMLELLYSSGLRLAELVGSNLEDFDFAAGEVRVTGKGNKTRIVPLGRLAVEALQTWLTERSMLAQSGEKALFVGKAGTRLTPRAVQLRLKQWGIKLGINANIHPHVLRHSFATHVLQSSGDLRAVQEMLGHANISTTQVYTHLDFQHLAKVYDAAHLHPSGFSASRQGVRCRPSKSAEKALIVDQANFPPALAKAFLSASSLVAKGNSSRRASSRYEAS